MAIYEECKIPNHWPVMFKETKRQKTAVIIMSRDDKDDWDRVFRTFCMERTPFHFEWRGESFMGRAIEIRAHGKHHSQYTVERS